MLWHNLCRHSAGRRPTRVHHVGLLLCADPTLPTGRSSHVGGLLRSRTRLLLPPTPDVRGRGGHARTRIQRESPPGIFVPVRGGLTHTLETSDTRVASRLLSSGHAQAPLRFWPAHARSRFVEHHFLVGERSAFRVFFSFEADLRRGRFLRSGSSESLTSTANAHTFLT